MVAKRAALLLLFNLKTKSVRILDTIKCSLVLFWFFFPALVQSYAQQLIPFSPSLGTLKLTEGVDPFF